MNAKTDGWESYTDKAGRRHWRWPASDRQLGARRPRCRCRTAPARSALPRPQQAQSFAPLRLKGK